MTDALTLSVVIPARNEEAHLPGTVGALVGALRGANIAHEILVVDDHSTDGTPACVDRLEREYPGVRGVVNQGALGFGAAVRCGLEVFTGDAVAVVMADGSDDPRDVVMYHQKLLEGYECVFGSRFISGAKVVDYPWPKLMLNRLANTLIRVLFGLRHNDVTNAFKGYRRHVIDGVQPLTAQHFNLTVELPLKAIVRGYSYATVPIRWYQRTQGRTKFKIVEMGSRYLPTILSVLMERFRGRTV